MNNLKWALIGVFLVTVFLPASVFLAKMYSYIFSKTEKVMLGEVFINGSYEEIQHSSPPFKYVHLNEKILRTNFSSYARGNISFVVGDRLCNVEIAVPYNLYLAEKNAALPTGALEGDGLYDYVRELASVPEERPILKGLAKVLAQCWPEPVEAVNAFLAAIPETERESMIVAGLADGKLSTASLAALGYALLRELNYSSGVAFYLSDIEEGRDEVIHLYNVHPIVECDNYADGRCDLPLGVLPVGFRDWDGLEGYWESHPSREFWWSEGKTYHFDEMSEADVMSVAEGMIYSLYYLPKDPAVASQFLPSHYNGGREYQRWLPRPWIRESVLRDLYQFFTEPDVKEDLERAEAFYIELEGDTITLHVAW